MSTSARLGRARLVAAAFAAWLGACGGGGAAPSEDAGNGAETGSPDAGEESPPSGDGSGGGDETGGGGARGWENVPSGTMVTLRGVWMGDAEHAWVVGDSGTILSSADGGKSWAAQTSPSTGTLRDVHFIDAMRGWIVGDGDPDAPALTAGAHGISNRPSKKGTVLITADGGASWRRTFVNTNFPLPSISMASATVGQIGSHGGKSHPDGDSFITTDGGESWRGYRVWRGQHDARWLDDKTLWSVGSSQLVGISPPPSGPLWTEKTARIVVSRNGGSSYAPVKSIELPRTDELLGIWMIDADHAVVVGEKGVIQVTPDAGMTWTAPASGTDKALNAVGFAGSTVGWVVGNDGTILSTGDGGLGWTTASSGTTAHLHAVHVHPAGAAGIAVGASGTILRLR